MQNYSHEKECKRLAKELSVKLDCEYLSGKEIKGALIKEKGYKFLDAKVPDLILLKDGKKIAIEVELTQKGSDRQVRNLLKYRDDLQFGLYVQVFYYCGSEAIKARLDNIVKENNISNVGVVLLGGIDGRSK